MVSRVGGNGEILPTMEYENAESPISLSLEFSGISKLRCPSCTDPTLWNELFPIDSTEAGIVSLVLTF